jgi:hypothetical protein
MQQPSPNLFSSKSRVIVCLEKELEDGEVTCSKGYCNKLFAVSYGFFWVAVGQSGEDITAFAR